MRRRGLLVGSQVTDDIPIGVNLIDWGKVELNCWLNEQGKVVSYNGWFVSDYIEISPAHTYEYQKAAAYWPSIKFFNADRESIGSFSDDTYQITADPLKLDPDDIPANAKYIRFTGATDQKTVYFKRIS